MAFNVAVSGLNAASQDLAVIGNNVANVSTTGFKGSRAEFTDVFAASLSGASGVAPGGGVRLSNVSQEFTQGSISFTDNSLDLAINGQGFFRVSDNGAPVYSRAGQFRVDPDGFIVNSSSQRLTGFLADGNGTITGAVGDLVIDRSNIEPEGTTSGSVALNLDANAEVPALAFPAAPFAFGDPAPDPASFTSTTSMSVFDSLGNAHELSLFFTKTAPGAFDVHAQIDGVTVGTTPAGSLTFGADGLVDTATSTLSITGWAPLSDDGTANGAASQDFTLDFSAATQFGSPFGVAALNQDGFPTGRLTGVVVDPSGVIQGRFTNGQAKALGQVALVDFTNAQGLQPIGDSTWAETFASGTPTVGEPGSGSRGSLQSGALEESNVELTSELTNLIVAQRNFQANAQTIRTADQVTQTIINLR